MGVISAGTPSRRHPSPIATIVVARPAQGKPQGFPLLRQVGGPWHRAARSSVASSSWMSGVVCQCLGGLHWVSRSSSASEQVDAVRDLCVVTAHGAVAPLRHPGGLLSGSAEQGLPRLS
jgi:hypothetical protein